MKKRIGFLEIQTSSRSLAMATAMRWAQREEETRSSDEGERAWGSSSIKLPCFLKGEAGEDGGGGYRGRTKSHGGREGGREG